MCVKAKIWPNLLVSGQVWGAVMHSQGQSINSLQRWRLAAASGGRLQAWQQRCVQHIHSCWPAVCMCCTLRTQINQYGARRLRTSSVQRQHAALGQQPAAAALAPARVGRSTHGHVCVRCCGAGCLLCAAAKPTSSSFAAHCPALPAPSPSPPSTWLPQCPADDGRARPQALRLKGAQRHPGFPGDPSTQY